jgi:chemotaxis protein histidine kinase CheA/ActR/RegA family two-component response regulator
MSDREVARLYIAEMNALLPVLREHLNTLAYDAPPEQWALAASEFRRLAGAAADLSADFHAEDCAGLATALARALPEAPDAPISAALLASAADALTHLATRVERMEAAKRVLAPSEGERAAAARLLTALARADARGFSGPLRLASLPAHVLRALMEERTPAEVAPAPPASALGTGGAGEVGGQLAAPDLTKGAAEGEPERVPLTEDDLAVLNAFRTGPLLRGVGLPPGAPGQARALSEQELAELNQVPDRLRGMFVFEASEDTQAIQSALAAHEQAPGERQHLAAALRAAHKLKGAAGTLLFEHLTRMTHCFEEQVQAAQEGTLADGAAERVWQATLEAIEQAIAAIGAGAPADAAAVARVEAMTTDLLARGQAAAPAATRSWPGAPSAGRATSGPISGPITGVDLDTATHVALARVAAGEGLLRVDVRRVDALMNRVSALAINRAEQAQTRHVAQDAEADLERTLGRLTQLSQSLADQRPGSAPPTEEAPPAAEPTPTPAASAGGIMSRFLHGARQSEPAVESTPAPAAPAWDRLELEHFTEYDQVLRGVAEALGDMGASLANLRAAMRRTEHLGQAQETLAAGIQQAVTEVRLVPLSEQIPLLQRAVRTLAAETGKQVAFSVRGETTEIDRDVSEALAGALTQLVRNAVAHGIEPPEERVALGKPEEGRIWIHAYYTGDEANIQVGDDGHGINPDQVMASALASGLIDDDTAASLSPDDALNLIFEQGITTVANATAIAGHGIGGDEVAQTLLRLRGSIRVRSTMGQGTTFHIRVPITLSVVRALHVRVAGQGYALPFAAVARSAPVPPAGPDGRPGPLRLTLGDREVLVPLFSLAELLGYAYEPAAPTTALVVELGRLSAALIVDDVLGDAEVVVRSLPPHLRRRSVRGASVSPDGAVLLLLDLPQLVGPALKQGRATLASPARRLTPVPAARPRILIADDSVTIRRAVEAVLAREGYDVRAAPDGMAALQVLLNEPPALLILDVEMPRLDGFELLSILRAHPEFAALRVVMLTSRATEKHRQYAESLGAHAYLVKPVTDDELLAVVRAQLEQE